MPKDTFWWRLVNLNPSVYKGVVVAVVAFLAVIGVHVTPGLPEALDGLIVALSVLAQALWVKSSVTPNAQVVVAVADPQHGGNVLVPGQATTTATDAAILAAASVTATDEAPVISE